MKNTEYKLTQEQIDAGVVLERVPDFEMIDVSDKNLERMAQGFIMGTQSVGRRKDIQRTLEEKVTKKIGRKGKYLTDKLFELIEGIYIEDKRANASGKNKGVIKYYQVPPNLAAITYALDRVLGKPKQTVDKSEERKGIILVEHVIRNLVRNPYRNVGESNEGEGAGTNSGFTKRIAEGVGAGALQE